MSWISRARWANVRQKRERSTTGAESGSNRKFPGLSGANRKSPGQIIKKRKRERQEEKSREGEKSLYFCYFLTKEEKEGKEK